MRLLELAWIPGVIQHEGDRQVGKSLLDDLIEQCDQTTLSLLMSVSLVTVMPSCVTACKAPSPLKR